MRRRQTEWRNPMPTKDRADIAHLVRALDVIVSGACLCVVRAVVGQQVPQARGVRSRIVCGSLMYRGGPSGDDDTLLFGGPDNHAMFFRDGDVSGHFWLEVDDDLVDFSTGDWRAIWDAMGTHDGLPPINWTVPPPTFLWQPLSEFATPAGFRTRPYGEVSPTPDAPPLGRAWYREADDGEVMLQECTAFRTAALLARRHTKQLIADGGRIHRTIVLPHAEGRA
jgi:hypothetical protein